jgi:hypothetical protein
MTNTNEEKVHVGSDLIYYKEGNSPCSCDDEEATDTKPTIFIFPLDLNEGTLMWSNRDDCNKSNDERIKKKLIK